MFWSPNMFANQKRFCTNFAPISIQWKRRLVN